MYTLGCITPEMYLDPSGMYSWKAVLGAIAVVLVVTAIVVATGGIAAVALGFGAMASNIMIGAEIGGLVCGGANLVSQGIISDWDEFNRDELVFSTGIGALGGALASALAAAQVGYSLNITLYQMFTNGVLGSSLYVVQSLMLDSTMTWPGAVLSFGSGMISGYFYSVPALTSFAISVGLVIIDKVQSYIESLHSNNETQPTT